MSGFYIDCNGTICRTDSPSPLKGVTCSIAGKTVQEVSDDGEIVDEYTFFENIEKLKEAIKS